MFGCTSQRGLGALRRTIAVLLMTLLAPVCGLGAAGRRHAPRSDAGRRRRRARRERRRHQHGDQRFGHAGIERPGLRGLLADSARDLYGVGDAAGISACQGQQRDDRGQPEPPAAGNPRGRQRQRNHRGHGSICGHPDRRCDARAGAQERGHRDAAARRPALHRSRAADAGRDGEHGRSEPARTGMARRQRQLARDEQLPARWLRQQPEHAEHAVAFGAGGVAVARYAR